MSGESACRWLLRADRCRVVLKFETIESDIVAVVRERWIESELVIPLQGYLKRIPAPWDGLFESGEATERRSYCRSAVRPITTT